MNYLKKTNTFLLTDDAFQLLTYRGDYYFSIHCVYLDECQRRGKIIQLALVRYRLEHGRLPETLDELQRVGYLDEIPRIPISGLPYYYDPEPKDIWTKDSKPHNSPILWAPYLRDVEQYNGNPLTHERILRDGMLIPLNFVE